MKSSIFLFCFVAIVARTLAATDYCTKRICFSGRHIVCESNGRFASTCPRDAAMVPIDASLKRKIVHAHNEKRNFIAGGMERNHSPACRMATMEWDDELAYFASLNVKQCQMNHDSCRNTEQFRCAGQNLAALGYFDTYNSTELFQGSVDMWYNEVANSKQAYIDSFPVAQLYSIGHFTAVVTDRNMRVGCAASTYTAPGADYKTFLVACNYAAANMPDFAIYNKCNVPASECQTGKNPQYPNLCSTNEEFDPNYGFDFNNV